MDWCGGRGLLRAFCSQQTVKGQNVPVTGIKRAALTNYCFTDMVDVGLWFDHPSVKRGQQKMP